MPITLRGKRYLVTVHHQGQRVRQSFTTKAEAESWEASTKAALIRGETIQTNSAEGNKELTLIGALDGCYKRVWSKHKDGKKSYQNALQVIDSLGGHLTPSQVTTKMLELVVEKLEDEGNTDATINRKMSAFSRVLKYCRDRGDLNVQIRIPKQRESQGRTRFITKDEEQELLHYLSLFKPIMKDFVVVGLDTGMRVSEILRLTKRDLHNRTVTVWVNKSSRPRSIPLTERAYEVVTRLTAERDRAFAGLSQTMVNKWWTKARESMNLTHDEQFVPHTMRHTFCSRLVQRGVGIEIVKELAGHSTIMVTMRYAHLATHNFTDAIAALEV